MNREQDSKSREPLAIADASAGYRLPSRKVPGIRPGYKQTEVGVIPEDWEVAKLEEAASVVDSLHLTPHFVDDGYPMVRVTDIKSGNLNLDGTQKVTEAVFRVFTKNYQPKRGNIVLSRVGSYGISSFVETDEPFCMGQNTVVIQSKLPPRFLYYVLNSRSIRRQIDDGSYGSGYKSLSLKNIKELLVPVPSTDAEQRAIAAALGDVDALLDGLERLIAKKRDLKQAAMQQLLTGQTRLPGFSGEWESAGFGDIAAIRNVKVISSSTPAGTQCIELESIAQRSGRLLGSVEATGSSSKYMFKKGDVLFGRLRAYLRKYWLASFDGVCSTEIWPLIPCDERLGAGYLHLLVQTNGFLDAASVSYGTHMPRSDWSVLRKFVVQLPPVIEQTAIASILSDMDAELSALEARRDKTRVLKQGMMQELLTGKTRLV